MSSFDELLKVIADVQCLDFENASQELVSWIDNANNFPDLVNNAGNIPESMVHDSTEEKLFSKASDAILSRGFRELGLKSLVVRERADSADVQAESPLHGYTLVADAKAFRLSRTARNQKDYKVVALSGWRKDLDYAVLCAPYFQYPSQQSQIYQQSITDGVCLFSWEYLSILLYHEIKETKKTDLSFLWNWPKMYADEIKASQLKQCYLRKQDEFIAGYLDITATSFRDCMNEQIVCLRKLGSEEIAYWEGCEQEIRHYTRKRAIEELIASKKIQQKIETIRKYVAGISYE